MFHYNPGTAVMCLVSEYFKRMCEEWHFRKESATANSKIRLHVKNVVIVSVVSREVTFVICYCRGGPGSSPQWCSAY